MLVELRSVLLWNFCGLCGVIGHFANPALSLEDHREVVNPLDSALD
jgi:hypothetical protein